MNKIILKIIIFVIIICCLFIPAMAVTPGIQPPEQITTEDGDYIWPIPGYTAISSPFGKRTAPTSGASTYHKGTDIPAPEGTKLIATCDGEITFIGFLGGGGYTITLTTNFILSCLSKLYSVCWTANQTGTSDRECRTKICLWSSRKQL